MLIPSVGSEDDHPALSYRQYFGGLIVAVKKQVRDCTDTVTARFLLYRS